MKQRFINQHSSVSNPRIKRSESTIHLSHYFWKPHHHKTRKNATHIDTRNKENIDPNITINPNTNYLVSREKISEKYQGTPKKRVIRLKSFSRNSKSRKGNSGGVGEGDSQEWSFAEVGEFGESGGGQGVTPSLVIEIDLLKQQGRGSAGETVSSSRGQNCVTGQFIGCSYHTNKKATFLVKGIPYCDKCAVPFITKGVMAVRIGGQGKRCEQQGQYFVSEQNRKYGEMLKIKEDRNLKLQQFIGELDKTGPVLERIICELSQWRGWLEEYCEYESNKIQQNWNSMMLVMEKTKQKLYLNLKSQQERSHRMIEQVIVKIKQEGENLSFMRSDITHNINQIIDESTVSQKKFQEVMNSFIFQLGEISNSISQISEKSLPLPKVEFDLPLFDQEISKFLSFKSVQQSIWIGDGISGYGKNGIYHLSFGKEVHKIPSPTFKVI